MCQDSQNPVGQPLTYRYKLCFILHPNKHRWNIMQTQFVILTIFDIFWSCFRSNCLFEAARSPTRPTSRSPTFPRSPSGSRQGLSCIGTAMHWSTSQLEGLPLHPNLRALVLEGLRFFSPWSISLHVAWKRGQTKVDLYSWIFWRCSLMCTRLGRIWPNRNTGTSANWTDFQDHCKSQEPTTEPKHQDREGQRSFWASSIIWSMICAIATRKTACCQKDLPSKITIISICYHLRVKSWTLFQQSLFFPKQCGNFQSSVVLGRS